MRAEGSFRLAQGSQACFKVCLSGFSSVPVRRGGGGEGGG